MINISGKMSLSERIPIWLDRSVVDERGCWLWARSLTKTGKYAEVGYKRGHYRLHKLVWEHFNGPVPNGLDLDHLCRRRHCWNPEHLEPVTRRVNIQRGMDVRPKKSHCPYGHAYEGENVYVDVRGYFNCRACKKAKNRARKVAAAKSHWKGDTDRPICGNRSTRFMSERSSITCVRCLEHLDKMGLD